MNPRAKLLNWKAEQLSKANYTKAGWIKKYTLIAILLAGALWLGVPTIQEALKIHDGKRCRENMIYIEKGKTAYRSDRGGITASNPRKYMDIIPYMPLKNVPQCPNGKPYLYVLDLSRRVECQHNGEEQYEAITPGAPPRRNGFHDLYKEAKYLGALRIPLKMLGLYKPPKEPFQEKEKPTGN